MITVIKKRLQRLKIKQIIVVLLIVAAICINQQIAFAGVGKKSLANSGIISPSANTPTGYSKKAAINKNPTAMNFNNLKPVGKSTLQFGKSNVAARTADPLKMGKISLQNSKFPTMPKIGTMSISGMGKMKSTSGNGIVDFGNFGKANRKVVSGIDRRAFDDDKNYNIFDSLKKAK